MSIRQAPQTYQSRGVLGVCDRCGFTFRHAELRKEWTGLMVCAADFDPRPPQLDPPNVWPEGLPIQDPRPEQPDIELADGDVTEDSY